jgi:small-conductance mechanosensitive channel
MRRGFFSRMNPTLRGFLIIFAIVAVIAILQLQATLVALLLIARIIFILAIAFFIYLVWRERREEISAWPLRARIVFYGAAALAVVDLGVNWYGGTRNGLELLAFIGVLGLCGFAMWRTWRDQHTYV